MLVFDILGDFFEMSMFFFGIQGWVKSLLENVCRSFGHPQKRFD